MKQIATFSKPEEAEVLRSLLEGSGISAYVRDSNTVAVDWALSNAVGGVKVEVADEDVERAAEILREFRTPVEAEKPIEQNGRRHTLGRYVKIAVALSVAVLVLIAFTVGFQSDVPAGLLVVSAFGIGGGIAAFCALYDL